MKTKKKIIKYTGRTAALIMCFIMIFGCLLPMAVNARENSMTVRVGWYESPFNTTDEFGRRSGYAYEYQKRIAAEISLSAKNDWDKVSVAVGMEDYDPETDSMVDDVVRRADKKMYENKRVSKEAASGR